MSPSVFTRASKAAQSIDSDGFRHFPYGKSDTGTVRLPLGKFGVAGSPLNTVREMAKYNSQTDTTTVVNHFVYDAFGKLTSESNPAVDSLFLCAVRSCRGERKPRSDYAARAYDPDSQLQNNLNRWYDTRVGRWLSEDPVGFDGGE